MSMFIMEDGRHFPATVRGIYLTLTGVTGWAAGFITDDGRTLTFRERIHLIDETDTLKLPVGAITR